MDQKLDLYNVVVEADKIWVVSTVSFTMPATEGMRKRTLQFRFDNTGNVEEVVARP
jgi:hypothetical protein